MVGLRPPFALLKAMASDPDVPMLTSWTVVKKSLEHDEDKDEDKDDLLLVSERTVGGGFWVVIIRN